MGGNTWAGTGPHRPDPAAAFHRAQEEELARDDHGFTGMTMAELWQDEEWQEYIGTGGTGTVLDFDRLVPADHPGDCFAAVRPLTERELRAWCPDGRPTRAAWEDALPDLLRDVGRGYGRCTVLYRDGEPVEVGYWGCTYD